MKFRLLVLGTPVGHSEYVRAWATTRAHKERYLLEQLPRLPDLQCAWLLLAMCASPRANHALRTVPPPRSPPTPSCTTMQSGRPWSRCWEAFPQTKRTERALWRGSPLRSEAWVCSRPRAWHRRPIGLPGLMPCRYSERGCPSSPLPAWITWAPGVEPRPAYRARQVPAAFSGPKVGTHARMASSCRGSPPSPPGGRRPGRLAAWLAKPRVAYPEPSLPRQRGRSAVLRRHAGLPAGPDGLAAARRCCDGRSGPAGRGAPQARRIPGAVRGRAPDTGGPGLRGGRTVEPGCAPTNARPGPDPCAARAARAAPSSRLGVGTALVEPAVGVGPAGRRQHGLGLFLACAPPQPAGWS